MTLLVNPAAPVIYGKKLVKKARKKVVTPLVKTSTRKAGGSKAT